MYYDKASFYVEINEQNKRHTVVSGFIIKHEIINIKCNTIGLSNYYCLA